MVALRDALLERDELVGDEIAAVIAAAVRLGPPSWAWGHSRLRGELPAPVVDIRS